MCGFSGAECLGSMCFCMYLVLTYVRCVTEAISGAECLGNRACDLGWLQDPHSSNCYRFFPASLAWKDARNR